MDVEGSGPVCKHDLLRDEAVVASSSAPLVCEIHGALVGPRGLIVMIRQRGMRGGSTRESRGEENREKERSKKAWKSKCEGGMWKIAWGWLRDEGGGRGSESQWGRNGERNKEKQKKIRRIRAHRCVHYSPCYSSDIHGHAKLSGRLSDMTVTSIWTAFLYEYLNASNCPQCPSCENIISQIILLFPVNLKPY